MGNPFQKVTAGQRINFSATAWNAFLDAAVAHRNGALRVEANAGRELPQTAIIRIRNDSGTDLARFSVVGLGDPLIDPADSEAGFLAAVALAGVTPTIDHLGKFAVLLEPAGDGAIVRAWAAGICPVKLDVSDDEDHGAADVTAGDAGFLTARPGGSAQVLWRAGGTGEQWALVRIGNRRGGKIGKTGASGLTARSLSGTTLTPGSGTGNVFVRVGSSWILDEDTTHTFRNSQAAAVPGASIVQLKVIDGELFVDVADC
jgi:hypothetical protein